MNVPEEKGKATRSRRPWWRLIERTLALVGLCFIVYHLGFELTVMTSDSMAPTLKGASYETGDRILVEKITSWTRSPRRWEIHFLYDAEGTPVAKRVIGLPGEKVSIRNNRVCINGVETLPPASVPRIEYFAQGTLSRGKEVACGSGFFVMGDDSG